MSKKTTVFKLNFFFLIKLTIAMLAGIAGTALFFGAPILSGCPSHNAEGDVSRNLDDIQASLANKLLRFHVIANSDSDADQNLKLKVKDAVVEYMKPFLNNKMTLDESKKAVNEHMDDILNLAASVIADNGYDYPVSGELTETYFPIKSYGDIVLPAGTYTAFRISIGSSSGKNWWCILYPPLCFVDVSYGVVPDESKALLQNVLDEDEYVSITEAVDNGDVEYRFRLWDFICGWFS